MQLLNVVVVVVAVCMICTMSITQTTTKACGRVLRRGSCRSHSLCSSTTSLLCLANSQNDMITSHEKPLENKVDDIKQHKFSVAPMMEYTDKHQRYLMRLMSKEAVLYTEMVVANAIVRSDHRDFLMQADFNLEEPVVLQLGDNEIQLHLRLQPSKTILT